MPDAYPPVLLESDLGSAAPLLARGKVRDIYDVGRHVLIVATDRLSAFDVVFPQGIPGKGQVLTQLSRFWFGFFEHSVAHHCVTTDPAHFGAAFGPYFDQLNGRAMLCRKLDMLPVECVARGYLIGSGWKDYQATGGVCGVALPAGLRLCDALPEPIFTPATKADTGDHDMNIAYDEVERLVGKKIAAELRETTLRLYRQAAAYARECGIILADTKLEFGLDANGQIVLADEVFTPDSSRYWNAATYVAGQNQPSLDKQPIRDYVESIGWNKQPPAPDLPPEIVEQTAQRYREVMTRLVRDKAPGRNA